MELETQESTQESNHITTTDIFKYKDCIFRWVDRYLKCLAELKEIATEDMSKDLVLEIIIKVDKRKHQIRNKESIKAWLYKLTINVCHDIVRNKQRARKRAKKRMEKEACLRKDMIA